MFEVIDEESEMLLQAMLNYNKKNPGDMTYESNDEKFGRICRNLNDCGLIKIYEDRVVYDKSYTDFYVTQNGKNYFLNKEMYKKELQVKELKYWIPIILDGFLSLIAITIAIFT